MAGAIQVRQEGRARAFESQMPCRVYGFPSGSPGGVPRYLGETPGRVAVPEGYDPIVSPTALSRDTLAAYVGDRGLQRAEGAYLLGVRDRSLLSGFCACNAHFRHLVLEGCGSTSATPYPVEAIPGLQCLELRQEVLAADLAFIERLERLECLVIVGCNNVFSRRVPTHMGLRQLIVSGVAALVNFEALIESIHSHFPNLVRLHLNRCGHLGHVIDLSPLYSLEYLSDFQAVDTRAVDPGGKFAKYLRDRREISGYMSTLLENTTAACFCWSSTHNQDLASLAERAPGIVSLELDGCNDVDDLAVLCKLRSLNKLVLTACTGVKSLAPLRDLESLRHLAITGCREIRDFRCVCKCKRLASLAISRRADALLSEQAYRDQIIDLYLTMPRGCRIQCDIPEEEIVLALKEVPQFMDAVKAELQAR